MAAKRITDYDRRKWAELRKFYIPNKAGYKFIQKHIKKLVPFVGSGLSVFAGYPDWSKLLKGRISSFAWKQ